MICLILIWPLQQVYLKFNVMVFWVHPLLINIQWSFRAHFINICFHPKIIFLREHICVTVNIKHLHEIYAAIKSIFFFSITKMIWGKYVDPWYISKSKCKLESKYALLIHKTKSMPVQNSFQGVIKFICYILHFNLI